MAATRVFVPLDIPEEIPIQQKEEIMANDPRPYCMANLGPPYGVVRILYPPKGEYVEGQTLTYNNVIHLVRMYKIVPVQMGMNWIFMSWDEAAGGEKTMKMFGKDLVSKHLREAFDIFATAEEEPEDGELDN